MQGPSENPGVNVRALTKLFAAAEERAPAIRYELKITLLEIYNEKIQDLLAEKGRKDLKAVQGPNGMEVQDLTMVPVSTKDQVLNALKRGSKNRHTTATNMNDVSSRSHLILSVYVKASNTVTGKDYMGKLHLIDLAGSERVGRSGVTGDALKEAQNINSSLSALGNCISARANKQAHVPYRDSTLTYLLQDSLEKNSKTLMFVQISPTRNDSSESVCSLRFAERVRKVELGKAEVNKQKK
jgi:kinesin family protein C2/C3